MALKKKIEVLTDFEGYSLETIRRESVDPRNTKEERKFYREIKKRLKIFQAFRKEINNQNPSYESGDHFPTFIGMIFEAIKLGRYPIESIGRIEALDNGTRGLASTKRMHLYTKEGNILDVADCHTNKYYYL